MIPMAREAVEMTAIAESPLILLFSLIRRRKKAAITTMGIANSRGAAALTAAAIANAPNPTWDKPSPIMEYLLRTRLTPRSAAQSAIREPPMTARTKKLYENILIISSNILNILRKERFTDRTFDIIVSSTEKSVITVEVQDMACIFYR